MGGTKYPSWENVFTVWTVSAPLSVTPPIPQIPHISNGSGTHRFFPTSVHCISLPGYIFTLNLPKYDINTQLRSAEFLNVKVRLRFEGYTAVWIIMI